MPPVDRNNPRNADTSDSQYTVMQFMREFPDDATCLEWLWRNRCSEDGSHAECPKCERTRKFHKVAGRPAWDCDSCGYHLHPTAGTIFHKSSTSLQLWFYAMHLMTSTRCGISAKQIERELGVTYKTAWRMAKLIRQELMVDDDEPLEGQVEADEMYVGGRRRAPKGTHGGRRTHPSRSHKQPVFGMVERGGKVVAVVAPDATSKTVMGHITGRVLPGSTIFTDEWQAYWNVSKGGYEHRRIFHKQGVYVSGSVHTNTIEGFWSLVKNGIRGVYHNVSKQHLQGYLNEYAWRYNNRAGSSTRSQFETLLLRAASGA
jgi:transposase-like protein